MARSNTWILIALVALLVIFGVYTICGKKENLVANVDENSDIEYVGDVDAGDDGDIELIEADEQPAFEIGFGMGPGLYGSGRATSEMIGN